jgi:F-type H+-transporting ATPase subunit gamma
MASLRDIRRRIGSVKNTRKITRAMKLVAGAKMRKAEQAARAAQPYQDTLRSVLTRVIASEDSIEHQLLSIPENSSDILIVVNSSDRGLCGSFNGQIAKFALAQKAAYEAEGKNVHFLAFGRKVISSLKSAECSIKTEKIGCKPEDFVDISSALGEELIEMLSENAFEKVILCYNRFQSVMVQEPVASQVLPMQLSETENQQDNGDYSYAPSGQQILTSLLPLSLRSQLLQAFLDTEAGEQAARMQAMDSATTNAGDMIDRLSLEYNRARQAAITTELTEIISGAEAL